MVPDGYTFGAAARQPAHRSLWFDRLKRRAHGVRVEDWLIHQANLRGFHGTYLRDPPQLPRDPDLSLEEIVIGLLSPAAEVDGRVLKLVVRILQSADVQVPRLCYLARAERAEAPLFWLVSNAPASERTGAVAVLVRHWTAPPRGYRGIHYDYDFARLVRRRASRDQMWRRAKQS